VIASVLEERRADIEEELHALVPKILEWANEARNDCKKLRPQ
jgi:hypothetical protein